MSNGSWRNQLNVNNSNNINNINNSNNSNNDNGNYFKSDSWDKYHKNNRFRDFNNRPNYHFQNNKKKFIKLYSAGVLPYSFDETGNLIFLLGKDPEGNWSDFGGRCEVYDNCDSKQTACREFYEETLGSISDISEMISRLTKGNPLKIISRTLNGSPYYMYVSYVPFQDYSDSFTKVFRFLRYSNVNSKIIEKTQIRWVTMDTLLSVLESRISGEHAVPLRSVFRDTLNNSKNELLYLSRT